MHLTKPSLSFFNYILEREKVEGDEAYFVDDREENTAAASSFGIKTFLYSRGSNDALMEDVKRILEE